MKCKQKNKVNKQSVNWASSKKNKKQNGPSQQVSSLSFERHEGDEKRTTTDEPGTQTEELEYSFRSLNIDSKPFAQWEFTQNEEKVPSYAGLPSFNILNVFASMFL